MITSLQNAQVKLATSLHLKKNRDVTKLFLVEGQEMIAMALHHGWEAHVIFTTEPNDQDALHITPAIMAKISKKENPQSMLAIFKQRTMPSLPVTLPRPVVALEEIRDPGNLGTIMRTSHAVGASHVILIGACVDPYAPEVIRASVGSFAAVTVIETDIETLRHWPVRLIATDVVQATDYRQTNFDGAAIVLGNEQKGISPALRALCDTAAHIPMWGGTESLNVAMAATLLLYETRRHA